MKRAHERTQGRLSPETATRSHETPVDAVSYAVAALEAAWATAPDKAALLPRLAAARMRITARGTGDSPDPALVRLEGMEGQARQLAMSHLERKKQLAERAVSLAQSTDWKAARSELDRLAHEWKQAGWSDEAATASVRASFNQAVATFTRRQEQWFDEQRMRGAPLSEYLDYLCSRAEQLATETEDALWPAASERLKQLTRLWKQAAPSSTSDPALAERFAKAQWNFQEAMERWYAANRARREELLHRVDILTDTTAGLGWEAARREVASIEEHDWRAAGPLPHDQQEALEQAFQRAILAFHLRQAEAEREALEQKEKVVRRIEGLARRPLDNWKATRAALLQLQQEYTDIGPVAASQEADLLRAYRAACQSVTDRLATLRGGSTDKRREVILAIRELTAKAGTTVSWRDARDKVLFLQKQYQGAGPVGHAEGEALWHEYRAACDAFFAAYRAWTGTNVATKEELCAQAEALLQARDPFDAKEQAKNLQQQWKASGPVPAEQAELLWSRFSAAIDKVFERAREEWKDLRRL
ncbi:MAG TPA: DUF349 domain-containing protein [Candidatus Cryosericum sp.]|nr:DUF349 domain-containing protein [Candidatus Cryosericum sp.]